MNRLVPLITLLVGAGLGLGISLAVWPVPMRATTRCARAAHATHDWDTMTDCLVARYGYTLERANDITTSYSYLVHPATGPRTDPVQRFKHAMQGVEE